MHIATSIDGLLNMPDAHLKEIAPCCYVDGKPLQTAAQVREMLLEAKAKGMKVIPNPECDNYDEKGYCKGHEMKRKRRFQEKPKGFTQMNRYTNDNPQDSTDIILNTAYSKDKEIWLRNCGLTGEDITLTQFVTNICQKCGCEQAWEGEMPKTEDEFCAFYEHLTGCAIFANCQVADVYHIAMQACELRTQLKKYEDAGMEPPQIETGGAQNNAD